MTIAEMHVWFRQYAQQMGMQNVRAILPEQIDNLINTSTKDVIDEVINRNVGTTNDRVITDNAKIANVNALRTLYKVKTVVIADTKSVGAYGNDAFIFNSTAIGSTLYFVDFAIRYSDADDAITTARTNLNIAKSNVSTAKGALATAEAALAEDPDDSDKQLAVATAKNNLASAEAVLFTREGELKLAVESSTLTRWFPIRVVDDSYLADILNDWVLAPRMRTPAMVIYALDNSNEDSQFELYVGENLETGISTIAANKYIAEIRCSYIKKPNKVQYLSDVGGTNVDSDLPEQLQIPMLKHAVDLYRVSIQGSLYANQQNAQQNQQELVRNNARPDNDGYQS